MFCIAFVFACARVCVCVRVSGSVASAERTSRACMHACYGRVKLCCVLCSVLLFQVFILMGQSNMLGEGKISGNTNGTLEFAVKTEHK